MSILYLSLGSNLKSRIRELKFAVIRIEAEIGEIIQSSSLYETAPWGGVAKYPFLNQVVKVETDLLPMEVLEKIQFIETQLGRARIQKWGDRTIDIDVLFYDNEIINEENLQIPQLNIERRRFNLVPLCEINADFVHPVLGKTIKSLLAECQDSLLVEKFEV